MKIVAQVLG